MGIARAVRDNNTVKFLSSVIIIPGNTLQCHTQVKDASEYIILDPAIDEDYFVIIPVIQLRFFNTHFGNEVFFIGIVEINVIFSLRDDLTRHGPFLPQMFCQGSCVYTV